MYGAYGIYRFLAYLQNCTPDALKDFRYDPKNGFHMIVDAITMDRASLSVDRGYQGSVEAFRRMINEVSDPWNHRGNGNRCLDLS